MMACTFQASLAALGWGEIEAHLQGEGFALLPAFLSDAQANELASLSAQASGLRAMRLEDAKLGSGSLHAFDEGLPPMLEDWRAAMQPHLASIARRWSERMRAPLRPSEFIDESRRPVSRMGAHMPPAHLTRLREEDFVALHQHAKEVHAIAFQLVALLSRPGQDFAGGEFVMIERRPRMQSRPIVVPLRFGDVAIVSAGVRPVQGSHGHYAVSMKQSISRVRRGARFGVALSIP